MKKVALLSSISWMLLFATCAESSEKQGTAAASYQVHCGRCHAAPDPTHIPKSIWEAFVLPEMAARMGYNLQYSPLDIYAMETDMFAQTGTAYLQSPTIDSATWRQIHDYLIDLAPDVIPNDTMRGSRNAQLVQFQARSIPVEKKSSAGISHITFDPHQHQYIVGDAYGKLSRWPEAMDLSPRFQSPVIAYQAKTETTYITEIGYMNPDERRRGVIHTWEATGADTLARELQRPVFTAIVDLNGDGAEELVVCEFGNLTGALSLLVKTDSHYKKRTLLAVPGTIKVETADMNRDGRKDLVVLASQGNEGIYLLYQEDELQFRVEQVIQMGPEYGSSWFELIDYDGDGDQDIVLANGDNADYSIFLKPYHGIRLFLNDGNNVFEETWFYPLYGATRVLAADYDLDGDWDFAVMAYFADFGHAPEEGFVFLENKDPKQYLFQSYTTAASTAGRWLVMEKGDYDQDGDLDLLLGSFLLPLDARHTRLMDRWKQEPVSLLLLENTAAH